MHAPKLRYVIFLAVCSFIITVVIITLFKEINRVAVLGDTLDEKMAELEKVERKNQELSRKVNNAKTADGVEREARERYNMVKLGEKIYEIKIQGKE